MEMVSELDRLVRLEEILRDEDPREQTRIILEWREYDGDRLKVCDQEDDRSSETAGED